MIDLEEIMKEKISADHLLYVSLKYTKTCDVMINLIKRWEIMLEKAVEYILEKMKKKKKIKAVPKAPKMRIDAVREFLQKEKDPSLVETVELFVMFKKLESLEKKREHEFRKGVCLRIDYLGKEVAINLEALKEYSEKIDKFINYVKNLS